MESKKRVLEIAQVLNSIEEEVEAANRNKHDIRKYYHREPLARDQSYVFGNQARRSSGREHQEHRDRSSTTDLTGNFDLAPPPRH